MRTTRSGVGEAFGMLGECKRKRRGLGVNGASLVVGWQVEYAAGLRPFPRTADERECVVLWPKGVVVA